MGTIKKINVRGSIISLGVDESLELPKELYKPSSIRSTTTLIQQDTNRKFRVSVAEKFTRVTRIK